jgi:hypothetical protein
MKDNGMCMWVYSPLTAQCKLVFSWASWRTSWDRFHSTERTRQARLRNVEHCEFRQIYIYISLYVQYSKKAIDFLVFHRESVMQLTDYSIFSI